MSRHVFNVIELFSIHGRGLIVETDKTYEQLERNIRIKIGDPVEFRIKGQVVLRSNVAGIEILSPWTPKLPFVFSLPPGIGKDDVSLGSEIWIDE